MLENLRLIPESELEAEAAAKEALEKVEEAEAEAEEPFDEEVQEVAVSIPEVRKDIFNLVKGVPIPAMLQEETRQAANKITSSYKKVSGENWFQKFMKNPNYYILDNEGGGDCLFATIRDAFSQIGQQTSVDKLRRKLSQEVTVEVYNGYKEIYDNAKRSLLKDTETIKQLEAEYSKYRSLYDSTLDRNEKKQYVEISKKLREDRDRVINEKRTTYQISQEYKFMKDIDSIQKFKDKIRTCEFWAETWAISTLERVLNVTVAGPLTLNVTNNNIYVVSDSTFNGGSCNGGTWGSLTNYNTYQTLSVSGAVGTVSYSCTANSGGSCRITNTNRVEVSFNNRVGIGSGGNGYTVTANTTSGQSATSGTMNFSCKRDQWGGT
jgi:hypothetical protein